MKFTGKSVLLAFTKAKHWSRVFSCWAALVVVLLSVAARARGQEGPEAPWLQEVKLGIERYAAANGGNTPKSWSQIVAHNRDGIERETKEYLYVHDRSPLEAFGLFPNGLPLPDQPDHRIILVSLAENIVFFPNADGQLEQRPYRHVILRNEMGKILIEKRYQSALDSIKASIDELQALDVAKPENAEVHPGKQRVGDGYVAKQVVALPASRVDREIVEGTGDGFLSYAVVGIISILSAALGSIAAWARCRG